MSELIPENDFREVARDMPDETSADVSRGHLIRWAMDKHLVHFEDGAMTISQIDTEEPAQPASEQELRDLQRKLRLQEAGKSKPHPHLPEAS